MRKCECPHCGEAIDAQDERYDEDEHEDGMSETKKKSTKVAIETAETGWIVRVQGEGVPRIFVRWEALVCFIRDTLTDYNTNRPGQ
jgi:hypothetical protein